MAKSPLPGRAKTRLCPPCSPAQAARLAEAMLADTLAAVAAAPASWAAVALEGPAGPWLPPGVRVLPQRGQGLDERLEAAMGDVGAPAVVIAGDTPQVTPRLLGHALAALEQPGIDAVFGPTEDAGYWALGLRHPVAGVFTGVPMSAPTTERAQRDRLHALGLRVRELPRLRDVDTYDDARAVALAAPASRFAEALAATERALTRAASPGGRHG
ncbi:TIGR04282 family arsenosugar biosynthesis glycosyltransferase [Streptomyces niveiscabiei]|uniref:DUF2064 domain-containing protein n=1 Tax=Streptomyces niveiscabiei TaxID=164115 RepID=A0ABW9HJG0_9ACTN